MCGVGVTDSPTRLQPCIIEYPVNLLNGTVPEQWINMSGLQSLSLDDNQFVGTLHASWANWSSLVGEALLQQT